jgi:hypothetical protein
MLADCATLKSAYAISDAANEAIENNDWLPAFKEIHAAKPYSQFMRLVRVKLPAAGGDVDLSLKKDVVAGAIFIDGFKSWNGTYAAMRALVPHIRKGTIIIFQDYSWFDCYWLPILANHLAPNMSLIAKVDNTAAFEIVDPDMTAGIEKFGSRPNLSRAHSYRRMLRRSASSMYHSGDDTGFLLHTAQGYALCHNLGMKAEAKAALTFLDDFCRRVKADWLPQALRLAFPPCAEPISAGSCFARLARQFGKGLSRAVSR